MGVALVVVVVVLAGLTLTAVAATPGVQSAERRLTVSFQGSVTEGGGYVPGAGERLMGSLSTRGQRIPTPGVLEGAAPDAALSWTGGALGRPGLAQRVLAEIVVSPEAMAAGGTLIDLGGAVRLTAAGPQRVTVTAGSESGTFAVPPAVRHNGLPVYHLILLSEFDGRGDGEVRLVSPAGVPTGRVAATEVRAARDEVVFAENTAGRVYGVAVTTGGVRPGDAALAALPCTAVDLPPATSFRVTSGECEALLESKAAALRPEPRQLAWQQLGLTAFVHFGMNTFTGEEWGTGDEDPDTFQPTDIDTDQWARTLRDNGFRLAVLTVKHHDGFVLYPSRYTDHDVAASSWQDGRGDVLRRFADSARRYGLKVGVYLSPADNHELKHGVYANGSDRTLRTIPTLVPGDDRTGERIPQFTYSADDYGAYFLNQLYEVLTEYGPIDEVWFDGAQGGIPPDSIENYDYAAYYSLIRRLAPQAVIAVCGPDVRWVGNEDGLARDDEWSTIVVDRRDGGLPLVLPSPQYPALGSDDGLFAAAQEPGASQLSWYPAEVDTSIRPGWFHHDDEGPKSVEQLTDIYFRSVGRDAVLLLNIPPDRTGALSDVDVTRLAEWRSALRRAMPTDLALGASAFVGDQRADPVVDGDPRTAVSVRAGDAVQVDLPGPTTVDRLLVTEDVGAGGQQIAGFAVDAWDGAGWTEVGAGGTVGSRRILNLAAPVTADRIRLRVTDARAAARVSSVSLYATQAGEVAERGDYYLDCAPGAPGDGTESRPIRSLAQLAGIDLPPGATVHVRSGTTCAEPLELWGYGTAESPARLTAWGPGPAPVVVAPGNDAAPAALRAAGWQIDGVSVLGTGAAPAG